jgi:ATP-binding cassette subfamily B protein
VRAPQLLVLDDLSSALDVETERLLWERLGAAGQTILAVTHRRPALERADHIFELEGGRLQPVQLGRVVVQDAPP